MNRVSFVIDGFFCFTLYEKIKHSYNKKINFEGLVNVVCRKLQQTTGNYSVSLPFLRSYYIGTDHEHIDAERNEYENALKISRFGERGRPLANGREKCIDTMLMSDVKEAALAGTFDYLVLLAGDLDHLTLVQDLKTRGIKTVLLYGEIVTNGRRTTGCSSELKAACFETINIFDLLEDREVFPGENDDTFVSLMNGMSSPEPNSRQNRHPNPAIHHVDTVQSQSSLPIQGFLPAVISAVTNVIREKEQREGRRLVFAFQAQVGTELQNEGVYVPGKLSEFFRAFPDVFKTGYHPITMAETVSLRQAC